MTLRKCGGRTLVVTPDGATWVHCRGSTTHMVKAWRRCSGGGRCWTHGEYATLEDLARAKGVNVTYVSRILQLTPLAPEIVEAIDPRPPADRANVAV